MARRRQLLGQPVASIQQVDRWIAPASQAVLERDQTESNSTDIFWFPGESRTLSPGDFFDR